MIDEIKFMDQLKQATSRVKPPSGEMINLVTHDRKILKPRLSKFLKKVSNNS